MNSFWSGDLTPDPGKGKASFLIKILIGGRKFNRWIGQGERHQQGGGKGFAVKDAGNRVFRMIRNINYTEADCLSDLLGGQSNAFGRMHGNKHLLGKFGKSGVERFNRFSFLSKD